MFQVRDGLFYTKDHEWVKVDGNKAKFGIDDYAQHEMGDLVYLDIPEIGTHVAMDEEIGAMESVKSVEPVYAPISGTIIEINGDLDNAPEIVNKEPFDNGWFAVIEMDDPSEIDSLMKSTDYKETL